MELNVQGMTCGHCEAAVKRAVHAVDPSATVRIDRAAGRVSVDDTGADPAALRRAIEDEGYQVDDRA